MRYLPTLPLLFLVHGRSAPDRRKVEPMLLLIEAPPGVVQVRRAGPMRRLLARILAPRLDRLLAEGASPDSSVLLAVRAAELLHRARRRALAGSIFALLEEANRAPTGWAAVTVDWSGVRRARWELAELAVELESDRPVTARGMALTGRLLCDGAGPLYHPLTTAELVSAVRTATLELDPFHTSGD